MQNRSITILCSVVLLAANPLAAQETVAESGPAIIEVSPDNQIINNSRAGAGLPEVTGPGQGDLGPGAWALGEGCADFTACLHSTITRGGLCGAAESLEVGVVNKCTQAAALGVCAERAEGGWECGLHKKLAQGKTEKHAVITCHGTGRFSLRGTKATDYAKNPDCLRSSATLPLVSGVLAPRQAEPEAEPPPEEEEAVPQGPGACTRAKACCRALASIEGMQTLNSACAKMNPLNDENGASVCEQIMSVIQGTITPLPKIPPACR